MPFVKNSICGPSSYRCYSNLLFMHVHARLSIKLRPICFWNGYKITKQREEFNYLPIFTKLQHFTRSNFIYVIMPRHFATQTGNVVIVHYWTSSQDLGFLWEPGTMFLRHYTFGELHYCRASCRPYTLHHLHRRTICDVSHSAYLKANTWTRSYKLYSIPYSLLLWLNLGHQQDDFTELQILFNFQRSFVTNCYIFIIIS